MTDVRGGPGDRVREREPELPARPDPRRRPPVLHRTGRWLALHPVRVFAGWAVLLVLATLSAANFTSRLSAQNNVVDGSDSVAASQLIREAFPAAPAETDFVVVRSDTRTARDPEFRDQVGVVVDRYRVAAGVRTVASPAAAARTGG